MQSGIRVVGSVAFKNRASHNQLSAGPPERGHPQPLEAARSGSGGRLYRKTQPITLAGDDQLVDSCPPDPRSNPTICSILLSCQSNILSQRQWNRFAGIIRIIYRENLTIDYRAPTQLVSFSSGPGGGHQLSGSCGFQAR